MDWVKLLYRPLAKRAARHALVGRLRDPHAPERGRFTRADAVRMLDAAWRRYGEGSAKLAPQPTLGSTMNVRLACFTFSFFEELLLDGAERAYAIELVADATWDIYRGWARVALSAARLTPGKPTALGFAARDDGKGTVSLRFPFNAPGYLVHAVPAERGTAFDVVHCPVAGYFRKQGAADLCTESWCNLDYSPSEIAGQKLVRTKTLVRGNDCCDFRVLPRDGGRS